MAHYEPTEKAARTRPKHYAEYALLRLVMFGFRLLSHQACLWVARRLGDLAFSVIRIRRRVTLDNLRQAFGDRYSESDYRSIARRCYRNFAMTFAEILRFEWEEVGVLQSRIEFEGVEHLKEAVARDRGIVYLTAHVGNWEMMGICLTMLDERISVVQGDQKNLFVDRLVKRLRERMGMDLIPLGSSLKMVLKRLRHKGRVALVADQDGGRDGIFVEYFGRPASTQTGPARFAVRTGAVVVIGLDRRIEGGRHSGRFYAPILPNPEAPEDDEVRRILEEYTHVLEAYVREDPAEWFWMHRRWKTRPPVGNVVGDRS